MSMKLMYITNNPDVAKIAEDAGVDRIFVDMEYLGKAERQGGLDTVQYHHTAEDVRNVRRVLSRSDLLVRVNPLHNGTADYPSSREEIDAVIEAGADIVMLPYFKTVAEAETFLKLVDGRAKSFLLLETPEAMAAIDEIIALPGIDRIHVGLNDLSLALGKTFLFELLADGTVERLAKKVRGANISFGFGGVASMGKGLLPSEYVIREHYRLGSTSAILSRSFCNVHQITDIDQIRRIFTKGVLEIRALEEACRTYAPDSSYFEENRRIVVQKVQAVCRQLAGRSKA